MEFFNWKLFWKSFRRAYIHTHIALTPCWGLVILSLVDKPLFKYVYPTLLPPAILFAVIYLGIFYYVAWPRQGPRR